MFEPVTARGLYKQTRQKLSADLHSTILLHTTSLQHAFNTKQVVFLNIF